MKESFKLLYKRKVYVHHYTQYMDVSTFDIASSKYSLHAMSNLLYDGTKVL